MGIQEFCKKHEEFSEDDFVRAMPDPGIKSETYKHWSLVSITDEQLKDKPDQVAKKIKEHLGKLSDTECQQRQERYRAMLEHHTNCQEVMAWLCEKITEDPRVKKAMQKYKENSDEKKLTAAIAVVGEEYVRDYEDKEPISSDQLKSRVPKAIRKLYADGIVQINQWMKFVTPLEL